jgi:hypothetical protein
MYMANVYSLVDKSMFTIDSAPERCAKGNEDEGSVPVTPSVHNMRGSKRSQRTPSITVPKSRSSSPGRKDVNMRRTKRKINHNSRDISGIQETGTKRAILRTSFSLI